MKLVFIISTLILSLTNSYSQDIWVDSIPFKTAIITAHYKDSISDYKSKMHIGAYGQKISLEIEGAVKGKKLHTRIIIMDDFKYKLNFKKKEVIKIPFTRNNSIYFNRQISDTLSEPFIERQCTKYLYGDSLNYSIHLGTLLLKLELPSQNIFFNVSELLENENLPINIFDIPKTFNHREFNYNFEE